MRDNRIFRGDESLEEIEGMARREYSTSGEDMLIGFGVGAIKEVWYNLNGDVPLGPATVDVLIFEIQDRCTSLVERVCLVRINECEQLLERLYGKSLMTTD